MLTVVMYHYVRDAERTRYPRIKARRVDEFEAQLDHVASRYRLVAIEDVIAFYTEGRPLPDHACLLTFDDGLRDHIDTVLPILRRRGISGLFAGSVTTIEERRVADVQKIHLILAANNEHRDMLREIVQTTGVEPPRVARWRFDPLETSQVKVLLQHALPPELREPMLEELFDRYVGMPERDVADELYMTVDDLAVLRESGMGLAGHGWTHRALDKLEPSALMEDVRRTLGFLDRLGMCGPWAFVYPSGTWNNEAASTLRSAGAAVAFTTEPSVVDESSDPLALPRLDTNDLPTTSQS